MLSVACASAAATTLARLNSPTLPFEQGIDNTSVGHQEGDKPSDRIGV